MEKCDRCGDERDALANERFWSGRWTERVSDGVKTHETLCDDCHSDLVRS
jgi:hypothetical protein